MKNIAYGKTMENLRNRVDMRLENNEKNYLKQTSKLSFVTLKVFDSAFVAIHRIKNALLKLNIIKNYFIKT